MTLRFYASPSTLDAFAVALDLAKDANTIVSQTGELFVLMPEGQMSAQEEAAIMAVVTQFGATRL